MHASKDSMWRGMWKILQIFLGSKQGPTIFWFPIETLLLRDVSSRSRPRPLHLGDAVVLPRRLPPSAVAASQALSRHMGGPLSPVPPLSLFLSWRGWSGGGLGMRRSPTACGPLASSRCSLCHPRNPSSLFLAADGGRGLAQGSI
jgi:hypothetical protein